jgi:hypothetical protein
MVTERLEEDSDLSKLMVETVKRISNSKLSFNKTTWILLIKMLKNKGAQTILSTSVSYQWDLLIKKVLKEKVKMALVVARLTADNITVLSSTVWFLIQGLKELLRMLGNRLTQVLSSKKDKLITKVWWSSLAVIKLRIWSLDQLPRLISQDHQSLKLVPTQVQLEDKDLQEHQETSKTNSMESMDAAWTSKEMASKIQITKESWLKFSKINMQDIKHSMVSNRTM